MGLVFSKECESILVVSEHGAESKPFYCII
jgi:hypothetical protein